MWHTKNIVIYQGIAKITDFGHSKSIHTIMKLHNDLFGNIRFVAPEVLRASKTKQDPHTKSSDIYSLGVLLWEISSGKPPFEDFNDYTIVANILLEHREERIPDTPSEYYKLYSECWNNEPKKRHTIEYIYKVLEKLLDENELEKEGKINYIILDLFYILVNNLFFSNINLNFRNFE